MRTETPPPVTPNLLRIISAYDNRVVRAYCMVRFAILRQRFLEEIGQYLPSTGEVLDIGCGFGLFALYFAMHNPALRITGVDRSDKRIHMAQLAAQRLGVNNVSFKIGDARDLRLDRIQGAYMLDLLHHIPASAAVELVRKIADKLDHDCLLLVKDIDTLPRYKMAFTWLLDKLMDWKGVVRYWPQRGMHEMLVSCGFLVHRHSMVDYLPYPHILYVATKTVATTGTLNPSGVRIIVADQQVE